MINYSKNRYVQLLKYAEDLKQKGKLLQKESTEDYFELLHYLALVYSELNWQIKNHYLEIFKDFLENKIGSFEFCEILKERLQLSEELSDTSQFDSINEKASKFTDFLDNVSISCDVCDRSSEPDRLPGHIGETEFQKEVEEVFFELQKFLEE